MRSETRHQRKSHFVREFRVGLHSKPPLQDTGGACSHPAPPLHASWSPGFRCCSDKAFCCGAGGAGGAGGGGGDGGGGDDGGGVMDVLVVVMVTVWR